MVNLNEEKIRTDCTVDEPLEDYSSILESLPGVEVIFRNHERRLIELLEQYPAVVGNVAWLTSLPVLDAMAKMKWVSIVVQKEDLWRPDGLGNQSWKTELRAHYSAVPSNLIRDHFGVPVRFMSSFRDPRVYPIRCVGITGERYAPRAHNKFLVFCDVEGEYNQKLTPLAVWTGSYNLTATAKRSFENAVLLTNEEAASVYFREYSQILALSEPLDWEHEYVAPEWRIGT